jgi:integrase
MPQLINRLDALKVRRAERPGYYADGAGLYLQVAGGGARSWIFRFTLNGRTRDMGLGSLATFSLAEARQAALEARKLHAVGIDPIERRNAQRAQDLSRKVKTVTFRQAADAYIDAHRSGWKNAKHAEQWRSTLETYVYPTIGDVAVDDVDTGMLVRILEPIWSKKAETANRVRGRIERILSRAASRGHRSGQNPAHWRGHLENILPARSRVAPVRHHAALPYSEIGTFMRQLRSQAGVAARALEFTILCATRTVETIGASWSEIDLDHKVWTIPAQRMKRSVTNFNESRAISPSELSELFETLLKLRDRTNPFDRGRVPARRHQGCRRFVHELPKVAAEPCGDARAMLAAIPGARQTAGRFTPGTGSCEQRPIGRLARPLKSPGAWVLLEQQ